MGEGFIVTTTIRLVLYISYIAPIISALSTPLKQLQEAF
jgi:hypothetical protein